ncbi:AbrB/MazE/SpoVT family DNA-binding domain-containing protein [Exiguobacterium mexicanum]|uniref:AbrB/MazE/SpoVT family DNA-binding domain-containing protein n=1 Tax=Exiguobacterium mexicanum TaxID=340146 RepID=UPI00384EB774
MLATKTKKVAVSSKRQIAIPKEFFDAIGIEKEIIMELNDGVINIKPVRTHTDDFSEEILADVIQEGFTGNDILKEFQRRKNMIRPAISQMIEEATSTKPTSIDDLFGDDDED